jgi:manganese/zinc/iron transport system permease protein
LVEALRRTGRVAEDAAIGLVFPALFAVGVIMVARFAANVHLDVDSVLLGEIGFAPFSRWNLGGVDMGPRAFYVMGGTLLLNVVMLLLFFKELKIGTFDAGLAASLGFAPVAIHYGLMTLVSVTAVGAFDAVGSILVVALMIAPPATALLLTESLSWMLFLSGLIGACSAVTGYWLAFFLDASIAGSMATMAGVFFIGALVLAPERGLLAVALRRQRQRWEFALGTLAIHLLQHEGLPEAEEECRMDHLQAHLNWTQKFAHGLLERGQRRELFREDTGRLYLTKVGRSYARDNMKR